MRGHLTEKADVFSFGVVALELVSGRPNSDSSLEGEKMYLLEWVCMMMLLVLLNIETISSFIAFRHISMLLLFCLGLASS
jgi:hypothetical protein